MKKFQGVIVEYVCVSFCRANLRKFHTVPYVQETLGRWLAPLLSNQAVTSSKVSVTYLSQNETKTFSTTTPWNFFMMIMPTMMTITYERRTTSSSSWFPSRFTFHYAPETFKMWSEGLTLLKFDNFTATPILRENKFWWIQTVRKRHFWQF